MTKKKVKQLMIPACVMAAVVLCLVVLYIIRRKGWSLAAVELGVDTCLCKIEITIAFPFLPLLKWAKEEIGRSPEKEKKKQKKRKKKRKAKKKKKGKKKSKNKK